MNSPTNKLLHKVSEGAESTGSSERAEKIVDWLQENGVKTGDPTVIQEKEEEKQKKEILTHSDQLREEPTLLQKRVRCRSPPPLTIKTLKPNKAE